MAQINRPVRILLPTFQKYTETVYFKGTLNTVDQPEIVIYITEYSTNPKMLSEKGNLIGWCSTNRPKKIQTNSKHLLVLEYNTNYRVERLIIDGHKISIAENCIILLYDHHLIKHSETMTPDDDNFSTLQSLICNQKRSTADTSDHILKIPSYLSSSMFAQHLLNYINLIHWLTSTIRRDKKILIKPANLILAILTDIIFGYLILELLAHDERELSSTLMGVLEELVSLLYSLLKWIMGAPAGLKLNNAFNKMLGTYFSYHIQLWWLFLDVSGEKLDIVLHVYHYVGYLGFTFQAALISDLICVATFHSYCIYVYAARLFNIQVSGLIALLRLFVGRKYNPLRGGIDSCEYTNQELFVGTVAFTISLLLLPTTTMYYIVFTLFRLLSLFVQYVLAKLIYIVQTLPLYVVILWLLQSPKVAGNILLNIANSDDKSPLVLRVKLLNKPVGELINKFRPPVQTPKHFEWSNMLSNVFVGKQII